MVTNEIGDSWTPLSFTIFSEYYVLNVFIDIQTSKELIQMDTDKMMTYGTISISFTIFLESQVI